MYVLIYYEHGGDTLVYVRVLHSQTFSLLHGGPGQAFHWPVLVVKLKRGASSLSSSLAGRIGQAAGDIGMAQPLLRVVGSDVRQRKRGRGHVRRRRARRQIRLVRAGLFADANVLDTKSKSDDTKTL